MEKIIVLGIGNILQSDEGIGVRVSQELDELYDFDHNVEVVDGGVLGLSLISVIERADRLIVVDAVKYGGAPGQLYRIPWENINDRTRYKDSLHQMDFIETMSVLPLIADPPKTVIIGVEPEDIETWSLNLTPSVQGRLDDLCRMVLDELDSLNAKYRLKEVRSDVFSRTRPNC